MICHWNNVRDMMYLCLRKIHSPNFAKLSPFNYLQVWMDLKYLFTFILTSPISYHKVQAPCYRPKWRCPCLNVGPDKQTGSFFLWIISKTAWYDLGFYQPIVQKIIYLSTKDSQYKKPFVRIGLRLKRSFTGPGFSLVLSFEKDPCKKEYYSIHELWDPSQWDKRYEPYPMSLFN